MSLRQPPRLATWLLDLLGYTRQNAALAGDLLEDFRLGRSAAWFWRQALMVIVNGAARNIGGMESYLAAVVAGFAVQVPATYALWLLQVPREVHGFWLDAAAAVALLAAFVALSAAKSATVGKASSDLRRQISEAPSGSRERRTLAAWISFDNFVTYLLCYCAFALFYRRLTLSELLFVQMEWLLLFVVVTLVQSIFAGKPKDATAQTPVNWPSQELSLPVTLSDGRTVLLRPETLTQSAAGEDAELAGALFRRAAPVEVIRRAIWLGSARDYLRKLSQPEERTTHTVGELEALIDEAARTEHVENANFVMPPDTTARPTRRRWFR